jgi:hypothetical protein
MRRFAGARQDLSERAIRTARATSEAAGYGLRATQHVTQHRTRNNNTSE